MKPAGTNSRQPVTRKQISAQRGRDGVGYPSGYASYSNAAGQTVNPLTGRAIAPSDPWWHILLK